MRYVRAKYEEYKELLAYRIYISDSFYYKAQGQYINSKYEDFISRKPKQPEKTAEEIVVEIMAKAGLSFKKEA